MSHKQPNKGALIKLPFSKWTRLRIAIAKLYFKAFLPSLSLVKGEAKKKETNYGESANKLTERWILPKKRATRSIKTLTAQHHLLDHKLKCNASRSQPWIKEAFG